MNQVQLIVVWFFNAYRKLETIKNTFIISRYNEVSDKKFYVTSKIYIKFLLTYQALYENKIKDISSKKERYQQGLEKLNFAASQVSILSILNLIYVMFNNEINFINRLQRCKRNFKFLNQNYSSRRTVQRN